MADSVEVKWMPEYDGQCGRCIKSPWAEPVGRNVPCAPYYVNGGRRGGGQQYTTQTRDMRRTQEITPPMRETIRAPIRFRERVKNQFQSPENIAYLESTIRNNMIEGGGKRHVLANLFKSVMEFSTQAADAIIASDPMGRRNINESVFWLEVKRLNAAFVNERIQFTQQSAYLLDPNPPRDGIASDDEPFAMRMFIADSLRPPGLEYLNNPGPAFNILEDQSTWEKKKSNQCCPPKKEPFSCCDKDDAAFVGTNTADEDMPWRNGNPNCTAEDAIMEYWGDNNVESKTTLGSANMVGISNGDLRAFGSTWIDNGGSRFMRYESIPFWQKGGREGYELDIDETLGSSALELGGHVRQDNGYMRWNDTRDCK